MRASLFVMLSFTLPFTVSCVRSPMLADASDVVALPTATDADGVIEMPPVYVESSYGQKIARASAEATDLATRKLNCPAVRVVRADSYERADGTSWTVVRLNVCGEQRVYEETSQGWHEATARLR
jgi:hypothetical protein